MASAQVLPSSAASSRKQEHLQAGKRRLEEFRKKKAAERAKKSSSAGQNSEPEINLNEKNPLETENLRVRDSDGAGTSNGPGDSVIKHSSAAINNDTNAIDFSSKTEQAFLNNANSSLPFVKNEYNSLPSDRIQRHASDQDIRSYSDVGFTGSINVNQSYAKEGMSNNYEEYGGALGRYTYGTTTDQSTSLSSQGSQNFDSNIIQSSFRRMDESQSKEHKSSFDSTISKAGSSHHSVTKISPQNSISAWLQNESNASAMASGTASYSLYEDLNGPTAQMKGFADEMGRNSHTIANHIEPISSKMVEENLNGFTSGLSSVQSAGAQTFESSGFMSHIRSSSNPVPLYSTTPETNSRRSRPSFLDSLIGPRVSSGTSFQGDEPKESLKSNSLKPNSMNIAGSSPFHKPPLDGQSTGPFSKLDSSSPPHAIQPSVNSSLVNGNSMERNHDFYLPKQNEDFTALEQHIEDLTQEKFSLQRALEASRTLSESLAAENSSLTDMYNQQRGVVDQLKSEMEKLQEEIRAQLAELEAFRNEYANAKLECNAADERAKLLASEVIGLEEKALRLRSSELKLERQLENSEAEISSCKKKLSSSEKDRMDLQSTIEALQEEKKLLQSKLRKAAASGKAIDVEKSATDKKDVSTSTEDLANEDTVPDTSSRETSGDDASSFPMLLSSGHSNLEFSLDNIPPDQMRMIQNINALIAELALEKEELIQTLASESSQCSKLKELNNELSRKLEVQTQRLELLTAQNMASSEHIPTRQPDSFDTPDNTPYADEGDEVVERVLGWIMKLFPGGPSKRRTSKLL
ncbi:protein BLISTER [Ziziphus jujuba]|uniref:Protein BLISTER n=1 Tax=Ziziphus jujuba TaxID=326968 RepID=A0A6P4A276_ZIZJJ|nr:protein BLISTER [Ziziphus jujuba]